MNCWIFSHKPQSFWKQSEAERGRWLREPYCFSTFLCWNSTFESNPISLISRDHVQTSFSLSEDLRVQGQMLQEADGASSCHLLTSACGHAPLLMAWRLQQLISALPFITPPLHPCSAPAHGVKEEREKRNITPASSMIKNISFETILEVAMVMGNSGHQGARSHCVAIVELQSWGQRVQREPQRVSWPEKMTGLHVQPTLLTRLKPSDGSQPLQTQMKYSGPPPQPPACPGGSSFPLYSNGSHKGALKEWAIHSESSELCCFWVEPNFSSDGFLGNCFSYCGPKARSFWACFTPGLAFSYLGRDNQAF